jgi:hypothetical protein
MSELFAEIAAAISKVRFAAAPSELSPPIAFLLGKETDAVMCVVGPLIQRQDLMRLEHAAFAQDAGHLQEQTETELNRARASVEHLRGDFAKLRVERDKFAAAIAEVSVRLHDVGYGGLLVEAVTSLIAGRDRLRVEAIAHRLALEEVSRHAEALRREREGARESRFRWAKEAAQHEQERDLLAWLHAEAAWRLDRALPTLSYWRDVVAPILSDLLRGMARRASELRSHGHNIGDAFRSRADWLNQITDALGDYPMGTPYSVIAEDAKESAALRASAVAAARDLDGLPSAYAVGPGNALRVVGLLLADCRKIADSLRPTAVEVTPSDESRQKPNDVGDWCNCLAIPGMPSYPGPWHLRYDSPTYPCSMERDMEEASPAGIALADELWPAPLAELTETEFLEFHQGALSARGETGTETGDAPTKPVEPLGREVDAASSVAACHCPGLGTLAHVRGCRLHPEETDA